LFKGVIDGVRQDTSHYGIVWKPSICKTLTNARDERFSLSRGEVNCFAGRAEEDKTFYASSC
jgi:hypothetical protein